MFTVQKKRVLCLSDLEGRNTDPITHTDDIGITNTIELSKALAIFVSSILGKGNERGELQIWANLTIGSLSEDTKKLLEGIMQVSNTGEFTGWGWNGQQKSDLKAALEQHLPKK